MRLSIEKTDPGYSELCLHPDVRIIFNGKPFTRAITADEERGTILAWVEATEVNKSLTDWPTEVLTGKVEIKGFPHHLAAPSE